MEISLYSFVMGVFWSSIGILLIYKFRRKDSFIRKSGVFTLLFLLFMTVVRMFLTIEIPHIQIIVDEPHIYPQIDEFFSKPVQNTSFINSLKVSHLLIFIWISVSVILSFRLFFRYRKLYQYTKILTTESNDFLEEYLYGISNKVCSELGLKVAPKIFVSDSIPVPCMFGFFKPVIFLPELDLDGDEWEYVISHELIHYTHKDMWIKLIVHILCTFYWWNPLVYLLREDLEQTLEIHCDMAVIRDKSKAEKKFYLNTLVNVFENIDTISQESMPKLCSQIVSCTENNKLKQRFRIIQNTKNTKINGYQKMFSVTAALMLFIISYIFILQPHSEPPKESNQFGLSDSYLLISDDESMYICNDNGDKIEISSEHFHEFKEMGFKIIVEKEIR